MNQDFADLLRSFIGHEVRFMVVGAYALAVHGRPRATGDLDVWIDATPENARRVVRALAEFGAPLRDVREQDFASPGVVFQMGLPPGRIDVLTQLSGVIFAEAWQTRIEHETDGLRVPVIGRDAFIQNKQFTGRPKDLGDIAELM